MGDELKAGSQAAKDLELACEAGRPKWPKSAVKKVYPRRRIPPLPRTPTQEPPAEERKEDDEAEDEQKEDGPEIPLDTTPIEIDSMQQAMHSNMETTAESDFVQDFRQNMKFKMATDIPTKRIENQSNQSPEELMKDIENNGSDNEDAKKF